MYHFNERINNKKFSLYIIIKQRFESNVYVLALALRFATSFGGGAVVGKTKRLVISSIVKLNRKSFCYKSCRRPDMASSSAWALPQSVPDAVNLSAIMKSEKSKK